MQIDGPQLNLPISLNWDDCTQSLYWVDYRAANNSPSIFRYDYTEGRIYSAYVVGQTYPVFIMPIGSSSDCVKFENLFAVGVGLTTYTLSWDGISPTANIVSTIFTIVNNDPNSVMTVAHQTENGDFYVGTFHTSFCSGPQNSSLYKYTPIKGLQTIYNGIITTTGVASDNSKGMVYHIDSCLGKITGFETGCNGETCGKKQKLLL